MSYVNKIFSVLVTSGNQGLAAAGGEVSDLPVGQLAITGDDGKTIAAVDNTVKTFQLWVKAPDGKLNKSRVITKDRLLSVHKAPYQAEQGQIVKVKNYKLADCDTTYTLAVNLLNVETLRAINKPNFNKVYSVVVGCPNCESENPNKLTAALVHAINNDKSGYLHASATKRSDGSAIADIDAFVASTEGADYTDNANLSDLVIEVLPTKVAAMCNGISDRYANPRITTLQLGLRDGFECSNGEVEVVQDAAPAVGEGYDVAHLEMIAGGWNDVSGPYRASNYGYLPHWERDIVADKNGKYTLYVISHRENVETATPIQHYIDEIIAVPKDDSNTIAALDALITQLTPEAND